MLHIVSMTIQNKLNFKEFSNILYIGRSTTKALLIACVTHEHQLFGTSCRQIISKHTKNTINFSSQVPWSQ